MQGKRWCFTLNNYAPGDVDTIRNAPDRMYAIIGKEIGDSGTPHLQGYITFDKNKRLSALKSIAPTAHWEMAKGTTEHNIAYCSKDGDFVECGDRPKVGRKATFADAVDMIVGGDSIHRVATDCPEQYARGGRGLRELKFAITNPYIHTDVRGEWYVGAPGTGKSHKARTENPGAYIKAQNKWWDGYDGEDVVILDDMDDACLKHYLKIWTDKWSCKGETKGGHVQLRHTKFIVTSNFTIDQLFGENAEICDAIKRRFRVTTFHGGPFRWQTVGRPPPGLERAAGTGPGLPPGLRVQSGLSEVEEEDEEGLNEWLADNILPLD